VANWETESTRDAQAGIRPVARWEVESLGVSPVASWRCERCDGGSGQQYRAPGSAGDDLRDAAISHGRITGHAVTFGRGTEELLTPLATAPAATEGER
jgi:hypothetical protein